MLEFKITEQNTIRVDNSKVVADFTKFIEFQLELPENWQGLTVNGLFYREEDETLGMVENIVSGEVRNLPSAPFKGEEFGQDFKVFISFVGTGADGKTATSSVYELTVQPSGLSGMNVTPEGDEENPFARFLRLVEEERKKAEAAAKTAAADAIEQLQPSIDEIMAAAGSASESAKNAARSENAAAGSADKAAQDRAAADQAVMDAEAAKQAARESAIAAAASQAAAAESEKKTEADAAKTGQDRAAAEQAASDAAAAKETAIQKAEAAEQSRLKAAESEQIATGAAEQSNVQAAAAERAAEAAQAAKKTAEEKARAATQSEQAAANSAAVCVEAGEKVSRAEAAAVRAEQAADSIQEAVDANNAAQSAKTETISAKNATIAASQTAQLEAQKVQQIVAGNEAYTKTESDLKYTVAPREEASSDTGELKLTDADNGLSYIELAGNCEQYTNTANKNLFDITYQELHGISGNKYLNKSGVIQTATTDDEWMITYYIKVKPSTKYAITKVSKSIQAAVIFYDKDKKTISGSGIYNTNIVYDSQYNSGRITTPENCEFIRVSFQKSTIDKFQIEEGSVISAYVKGAIDTPSPEYPSEVRSVGDIPKDVNGVEIRNLLPNENIENLLVYEDTKDFIYLKLAQNVKSGVYCAFSASATTGNGLYCRIASTIPSWGPAGSYQIVGNDTYNGMVGTRYSYSFTTPTDLYVTFTRATLSGNKKPDKALIKQFFEKHTIMITEAAEIDEYRPYIGENNGLVKLESTGKNLFDINIFNGVNNTVQINGNEVTWTSWSGIPSFNMIKKGFKENTQYCVSFDKKADGITNTRIVITYTDDTGDGIGTETNTEYKHYTGVSRAGKTIKSITATYGGSEDSYKMFFRNIQIEEGTKETSYQLYHQQITWIPLREPLQGLYDPKDTIDKDGYVTQKYDYMEHKLVRFTGVSGWKDNNFALYSVDQNTKRFNKSSYAYSDAAYLSNGGTAGFPVMITTQGFDQAAGWYFALYFPYGYLGLSKESTDEENKQKIIDALGTDYKIKVWYYLIEPITYQIPAVYIETHDPETNVRCLNKVKPSDMTLDYKIAMSSLIKRLEALESKTVQEV